MSKLHELNIANIKYYVSDVFGFPKFLNDPLLLLLLVLLALVVVLLLAHQELVSCFHSHGLVSYSIHSAFYLKAKFSDD